MIRPTLAAACALALACGPTVPAEPVVTDAAVQAWQPASVIPAITVMTWNVYPGTDLDAVIAALVSPSPADDIPALVEAYQTLVSTSWEARAAAIATEIARSRPMVVGLQEISEFDLDLTALYPDPVPIEIDFQISFLPHLMDSLEARGATYHPVSIVNIDVNVAPAPLTARFVDREVMLIRDDLWQPTLIRGGNNFTACLGPAPCLGGVPFPMKRGYVYAVIPWNGVNVLFVSAHPESGQSVDIASLRAAQVYELLGWINTYAGTSPVVLMGDLNEQPNVDLVPTLPGVYEMLMGAGYTDVWRALRPGVKGYTCCHEADLSEPVAKGFDERIDYILARGLTRPGPGLQGSIDILGLQPSARVMGWEDWIWPSDHAGLVARLMFPKK